MGELEQVLPATSPHGVVHEVRTLEILYNGRSRGAMSNAQTAGARKKAESSMVKSKTKLGAKEWRAGHLNR
jgi:hypothetical protein